MKTDPSMNRPTQLVSGLLGLVFCFCLSFLVAYLWPAPEAVGWKATGARVGLSVWAFLLLCSAFVSLARVVGFPKATGR